MKLLILTMDYPRPDGTHERMFVHVRDLFYQNKGIDVTVLNFSCDYDYTIDGIKVITLKTFRKTNEDFDAAVSHASNLRHHYRFLKRYADRFRHLFFFFHGHEVLYLNQSYPKPYSYVKKSKLRNEKFQDIYDKLKISLWSRYYKKLAYKAHFIFVSRWIKDRFHENTGLTEQDLLNNCCIINNSIGQFFETSDYDNHTAKEYDFITIRSNLDGSKYGIDLAVKLAEKNPGCKFLIIGRGKFFDYNNKPDNVIWINKSLNHSEMCSFINQSKCALLLTREDTQGVMTCEMAAFGIPVITSDIEVCHEFFDEMPNVTLINNDLCGIDILQISDELRKGIPYPKNKKYFGVNTISKEVDLFKEVLL